MTAKEAERADWSGGGELALRSMTEVGTKSRIAIGVPYDGLELRANGVLDVSRSLDLEFERRDVGARGESGVW